VDIGIIGLGVVGSATKKGLEYVGHNIFFHDLRYNTSIQNCISTDVIFICLPTPNNNDQSCDTSAIENTIKQLDKDKYKGIIAIKSTVYPGFTKYLQEKYSNLEICFVPEFLREKTAYDDFINQELLLVGTSSNRIFTILTDIHKDMFQQSIQMSSTECEIVKYMTNSLAALRIVFANIFYELSECVGADYEKVRNALVKTKKINDLYLDVNKDLRGYGGSCLPKDVEALSCILKKQNLDFNLIQSIIEDNKKFG
jgi:UDPglucose 6-dehydrogenase